jgi:hypothetical protein
VSAANPTTCLVAGMIYFAEGNHVEALKACHGSSASLEMQALSVQVYLAMNRSDQAEKTVKVLACHVLSSSSACRRQMQPLQCLTSVSTTGLIHERQIADQSS